MIVDSSSPKKEDYLITFTTLIPEVGRSENGVGTENLRKCRFLGSTEVLPDHTEFHGPYRATVETRLRGI